MFGSSSTGGTGLFGNAQNKPAGGATTTQPSGFLFGSSSNGNTNQPSAFGSNNTSGGLFGSKPAAPASGSTGGLFGGSNSAGSTGSTFLNNNNTANLNSGGLFGSNTSNSTAPTNTASGGLFGKPASASGGLFGSTNNNNTSGFGGGSTFGNTNQNTQTSAQSGGLFGNNAQSNTQGGGLFGNNAQNTQSSTQSGGLFGNTTQNSNQSGGLFGNNAQNNQSAGQSGGLFSRPAGTTGNTTSGGLFGASAQSNTSGGLFGSTQNKTGGLFGASNNASSANTNTNNGTNTNTSGGLFGSQNPNNAQPSFSWSTQNTAPPTNVSGLQLTTAPPKTQQTNNYTPAINDQIIKLKEQWDPNSPKCALKTHLYNKFSEQEINVLMQQPRPANESPEDWDYAMAHRPSPLYYPVKVSSFSEVAQRVEVQLDHVAKLRILLNNINEKLTQLSSKHDLDNTTRILQAKVRHTKLSRRLLRLATILAVLKLKGYPLLPEEEEISKQFQALNAKISDPNGSIGKLSDLYARLAILKGRSEDLSLQLNSSISNMHNGLGNINTDHADTKGDGLQLDQIVQLLTKLLYKQQAGLSYLNEVVQKDLEVVDNLSRKE